jgi:hypothetical protein
MAITSDGTQAFGVESPLTINAVTYVCEGLSFNFTGTRADINDSNGEPLGSTVIPGRTEVSGTLQLAAGSTESRIRGQTFTIDSDNNDLDGTYLIVECSEAQTQGDYAKVSFTAYLQIN